ncbi:hypothetical protein ACLOJK_009206 [Asimina triloba]
MLRRDREEGNMTPSMLLKKNANVVAVIDEEDTIGDGLQILSVVFANLPETLVQ